MRILIIGGTGVLSRAIAVKAVMAGHQVTILTDGKGQLPEPEGIIQHLKVDRNNVSEFHQAILSTGVKVWDLVIDVICYYEHQAQSLLTAIKGRSRHTIVISTAILYGLNLPLPLRSEDPFATPSELGKYGTEKVKMEGVWQQAWQEEQHPVTIFRPPHILGIGAELGVIPLHNRDIYLIDRLLKNQSLLLADGGRQSLQIVFNEDVADVVLAAAGQSVTFGKTYNCANSELLTGRSYFQLIAELLTEMGYGNIELVIKNVPSEVIWNSDWGWSATTIPRLFDMTSLQQDIGIIPSTPAKLALKVTLEYLLKSPILELNSGGSLMAIEKAIDQKFEDLAELLSEHGTGRKRLPIDLRMNTEPPQYKTAIKNSNEKIKSD